MKSFLSPVELAAALGVSQSSIKRWTDDGVIEAVRTGGGHRRIAVVEAVRFARASGLTVVKPELLGLSEMTSLSACFESMQNAAEALFDALLAGAAAEARALILGLYFAGHSIAAIGDGPIKSAQERIGLLWHDSSIGLVIEHRATQICLETMGQLRSLLKPSPNGPLALGGAPSGDTYQLPSLLVTAVLESEGFRVTNLGPELPFSALSAALKAFRPELFWLSVSACHNENELSRDLRELVDELTAAQIAVALGGRALPACPWAERRPILVAGSLAELVAFVRGAGLGRVS